jgi:hypothetical protein
MKKITVLNVKKNLVDKNVDPIQLELILNNIHLFNDQVDEYNTSKHNAYLLYQLSLQIFKMLQSIDKTSKVEDKDNDQFMKMINEIKANKIEKR